MIPRIQSSVRLGAAVCMLLLTAAGCGSPSSEAPSPTTAPISSVKPSAQVSASPDAVNTPPAADAWPEFLPTEELRKTIQKTAKESGIGTILVPGITTPGAPAPKVKAGPNSLMMLNYQSFTVIESPQEFKGVSFALSFSVDGKPGDTPIPIKVKFPKGEQSGLYVKRDGTYLAIISKELGRNDIEKLMDSVKKL